MTFFEEIWELLSSAKYMEMIYTGLGTTVLVSFFAAILGLVLGTLVALVAIAPNSAVMKLPKLLCKVYVTVIRGTPMALQLFIMMYAIFAIRGFPQEITAILAFGINSGAYVSESIRGGILSVDIGQTEAGRALGLSGKTTMMKIVIPQAIKNIIPTLGNEYISLVKETSIVSFATATDIFKSFREIGDATYEYVIPYFFMAVVYIVIVLILTLIVKAVEARLRRSEK